jgi:hypothetical protein
MSNVFVEAVNTPALMPPVLCIHRCYLGTYILRSCIYLLGCKLRMKLGLITG